MGLGRDPVLLSFLLRTAQEMGGRVRSLNTVADIRAWVRALRPLPRARAVQHSGGL